MDRNIISLEMFGDGAMWEQKDCIARDGGCPKNKWGSTAVDELPLAMVYGPMQKFVGTYDPEEGLLWKESEIIEQQRNAFTQALGGTVCGVGNAPLSRYPPLRHRRN